MFFIKTSYATLSKEIATLCACENQKKKLCAYLKMLKFYRKCVMCDIIQLHKIKVQSIVGISFEVKFRPSKYHFPFECKYFL